MESLKSFFKLHFLSSFKFFPCFGPSITIFISPYLYTLYIGSKYIFIYKCMYLRCTHCRYFEFLYISYNIFVRTLIANVYGEFTLYLYCIIEVVYLHGITNGLNVHWLVCNITLHFYCTI